MTGQGAFGLSAGPLDWRFGGEYVLLALRALRDEGTVVRWRVVGGGPDRERILFGVHDLDLVQQVELLSGPAEGFHHHLAAARWALLPWIRGGAWTPFAEAVADRGLPSVGADPGATACFTPRDVSSLAAAIRRVGAP